MRFLSVTGLLAASLASLGPGSAGASSHGATTYYLALGDSLAAQDPNDVPTYPARLFQLVRDQFPDLRLHNLACAGESTDTMMRGGICPYPNGSQLDEARAFLAAHQGEIGFITIDIGGNDVLGTDDVFCWDFESGLIDLACIQSELPGIQSNLTTILETLQGAAPGVPIFAMSYYDPFLGYWVHHAHLVARSDEVSWEALNGGLVQTYQGEGVLVADVAGQGAFDTDNFSHRVHTEKYGEIPINVAKACRWTRFCRFGDVHPNAFGHSIIADAFATLVGL